MIKIITDMTKEIRLVDELLRQLIEKYSKLENKKHLYKDLKELTIGEINTIIVIGIEMKTMSEIANKLGVSFGTPTITIDRLIKKEYVERIRDVGDDRRQVFIKLSAKGMEIYNSVVALKERVSEKIFGILTDSERQAAISILSKVNNQFNELFFTE